MEEMGDDEALALVGSAALGLYGLYVWYGQTLSITRLGTNALPRMILYGLPALAFAGLGRVVAVDAALDVRTDVRYQALFVLMGSIWILLLPQALTLIGVSYRDDALERRNVPAALALGGTSASLAILFAASNMGEGPSIWNTVETAVAATLLLCTAVMLLAMTTAVGQSIAVERDVPSGLRFAGWVLASGIVLSRACVGDWISEAAMLDDLFEIGWPVLVLLVLGVALELALRPRLSAPRPSILIAGVVPAASYLALSLAYVVAFV